MRACLFIVMLCLMVSTTRAQSVINFSRDFKKICLKSNDILAKKVFITICKLEKRAVDPCDDSALNKLLSYCGEQECSAVLRVYQDAVYRHEGRVIGQ